MLSCPFALVKAQNDDDPVDPNSVNLDNPAYSSFFTGSCSSTKSTKFNRTSLDYVYYQNDPEESWPDQNNGDDYCSSTIGATGCALTCIAMILKNEGEDKDPGTLQDWMYVNNGFDGCSVVWGSINADEIYSTTNIKYAGAKKNIADEAAGYAALRELIDGGGYAIVHVTGSKQCGHWILVYGYNDSGSSLDDFLISDPNFYSKSNSNLGEYTLCNDGQNMRPYIGSNATKAKIYVPKNSFNVGESCLISITGWPNGGLKTTQSYCNRIWVIKNISLPDVQYINRTDDSPSFTFDQPGTYSISLAVEDENGFDGDVVEVQVNGDPTATPNSYGNTTWTADGDDTKYPYICFNCVATQPTCTTQPPAPSYFYKSTISGSGFTVHWAKITCADSYKVYISNNGSQITGSPFSSSNGYYTASGLTVHTTYTVQVSSVNNTFGESSKSGALSIYTTDPPPPPPPPPPIILPYASYSYVGNCWYATAMNTNFNIQDHSYEGSNPHIWVCWDFNSGCGTLAWDAGEQWAYTQVSEDYGMCYITSHTKTFKQMYPDHIINHIYTSEGQYIIRYYASPDRHIDENDCDGSSFNANQTWGGANIVDCSKSRNSTQLSSAINYDMGWGHAYFSGSFVLNSLSQISTANSMKLILSACNSIELDPGITLSPINTGNYIQLEVGVIEGSQTSTTKSAEMEDIVAVPISNEPTIGEENINVFPNPNNGSFTVTLQNELVSEVQVLNMCGQMIQYSINNNVGSSFAISLPGGYKGMYLVRLRGKQKTYVQKIVVE